MIQVDSTKPMLFSELIFGDLFVRKSVIDLIDKQILYQKVLIKRPKDVKDERIAICVDSGISVEIEDNEILYPVRRY